MLIFIFITCIYTTIIICVIKAHVLYIQWWCTQWTINRIPIGHRSASSDWLLRYTIYTMSNVYACICIFMKVTTHNILLLLTNKIGNKIIYVQLLPISSLDATLAHVYDIACDCLYRFNVIKVLYAAYTVYNVCHFYCPFSSSSWIIVMHVFLDWFSLCLYICPCLYLC